MFLFYLALMLIIKTDQPNYLVVTVSQNSELTNPQYLFSFVHIFSKERVSFIPVDVSTHKSRYDEFYFVEGVGPGQINFPYAGQYLYTISEQPAGSGNLDPALATNVVENGEAQIIVQSAITQDSQYDIFVSNDEFDSNIIFAPDEPNPTPNLTPSITPSPTPSGLPPSPTPTPSITPSNTPTITPTPSSTPTTITPATFNALWWVDFTDAATLNINGGTQTVIDANDKIANVQFSSSTLNGGPIYNATGYNGVSGDTQTNANPLENPLGTYNTHHNGITWFGTLYDDISSQRGGCLMEAYDGGFPFGTRFIFIRDLNNPPSVWYANVRLQGGGSLEVGFTPVNAAWTSLAVRAYQQSGDVYLEVWENGSIIASGTSLSNSLYVLSDHQYRLMFDGGIDFNTEQFYFDKKLNNSQMNQMFTYINNKY